MSTATIHPITYGDVAALARFSVARYQKMIATGILTPDDKVELLENYVVIKMPKNPPHEGTIDLVKETLSGHVPAGWLLRIQQPVELPDSQPEPDFALVRGNARSSLHRHPVPADIGLLIEVADSSLLRDQRDKTRIHARAAIACYWIVNLPDQRIEVYTQPTGPTPLPAYGSFQIYQPGDDVPLTLDNLAVAIIPVADLLP